MSINIRSAMCRVADSIAVNIDTRKLGPRVKKGMERMIRTGNIGPGLGGDIALAFLRGKNLPFVRVNKRYAVWGNVQDKDSPMFAELNVVVTAMALSAGEEEASPYSRGYIEKFQEAIAARERSGYFYIGENYTKLVRYFSFPEYTEDLPVIIPIDVLRRIK